MEHCQRCGTLIVWGITPKGKRCPYDAVVYTKGDLDESKAKSPFYDLQKQEDGSFYARKIDKEYLHEDTPFSLSHFATCTHPQEFSKKAAR